MAKGKDKGKGKGEKGKGKKKSSVQTHIAKPLPVPPKPQPFSWEVLANTLPDIGSSPQPMACLGAQTGAYAELCDLLQIGLKNAGRVLLLTPWGFFPVFREVNAEIAAYFVTDACTCIMQIYRFYDLRRGTAGFLRFDTTHDVIKFILETRFRREKYDNLPKSKHLDDAIRAFCLHGNGTMADVCCENGIINSIEDRTQFLCLLKQAKKRQGGDVRISYSN